MTKLIIEELIEVPEILKPKWSPRKPAESGELSLPCDARFKFPPWEKFITKASTEIKEETPFAFAFASKVEYLNFDSLTREVLEKIWLEELSSIGKNLVNSGLCAEIILGMYWKTHIELEKKGIWPLNEKSLPK